jgi:dipeptidase
MKQIILILMSTLVIQAFQGHACTSYLVTKGASADGSTMISYAGDSHIRYGQIYFFPRAQWPEGSMVTIYDRSSNRPLGQIPQPAETYQVTGFMNEFQVAIGESTFGGRRELRDTTGMIDWGSIMFLALQRSKTAREAVKVMAELLDAYGYYSSGQSYSIADPNEVWIMEIIGKGVSLQTDRRTRVQSNVNRGAVWVARRIPDGYISAHANHSRITQFPMENGTTSISSKNMNLIHQPDVEVVYAHDVISFAREKGYFSGADADFSFSDAYAPLDFGAARFCELRVWAMFQEAAGEMESHWEYATGEKPSPKMPLWVKPKNKLTPRDLMRFKRNTLEGTDLDMSKDFGAGPHGLPYRWRPLTFEYDGKEYFNERTTATQQTAFSWVAQMRSWLPDPIGGIFWYGLDDAGLTLHAPFYSGMLSVPYNYQRGHGDILTYSENAAFWVFNRVSHFAYLFYDRAIVDIRKIQEELESRFEAYIPAIDAGALILYEKDPMLAKEFLTEFSHNTANNLLEQWKELGNFLLVKYLDGNVKQEKDGVFLRNPWDFPLSPKHPEYPDTWKRTLIEQTGDKFLVPSTNGQ